MPPTIKWLSTAALFLAAAGCTDDKSDKVTVAPAATALAPSKPPTMEAKKLTVDKGTSKVDFVMEAAEERINGHVPGATTGELQIDFMDVTKSTGLITVDISGIEITQSKADKDHKFGPETKVEKQNEHARAWFEIGPDDKGRAKNALVSFSIKSIETTGEKNLTKLTGPERKVPLKITGELLLHGHKSDKVAELDATFRFEGDKPVSVTLKSTKPFAVALGEHDVQPHDPLGKGLAALSGKVAKDAMVSLDFTAKLAN